MTDQAIAPARAAIATKKGGVISQALPSDWYIVRYYAIDLSLGYHGLVEGDPTLKVVNRCRRCTGVEEYCAGVWV